MGTDAIGQILLNLTLFFTKSIEISVVDVSPFSIEHVGVEISSVRALTFTNMQITAFVIFADLCHHDFLLTLRIAAEINQATSDKIIVAKWGDRQEKLNYLSN